MATNGDDMGRWADDGGAPGPEPQTSTEVPLTAAEQFFYDHAGISWTLAVETQEDGRVRGAREMARTEAWAASQGLVFTWEDDTDADTSCDEDDGPAYGCMVRRPGRHEVLASLWGITLGEEDYGAGRDPYCRVVEAALASEVKYVADADEAMLAGSPEMRALVAYALGEVA
jgi:hypothetical protein